MTEARPPLWKVRTARTFDRSLRRLDRPVQRQVIEYLEGVGSLDDPRARGHGLTGNLAGLWRYRIGDYRVLAEIHDPELLVIALDVAHRSEIYDR